MTRSGAAVEWLRLHGGTIQEAARVFGISRQAVQQEWAKRYHSEPLPSLVERNDQIERVLAAVRGGMTAIDVANSMNISLSMVYAICRREGVVVATKTDHSRERFDKAVEAVANGMTIVDAAAAFEISMGHLGRLLRERGIHARWVPVEWMKRRTGRSRAAAELVAQGMAPADAARKVGVSTSALSVYLKRLREKHKSEQAEEIEP